MISELETLSKLLSDSMEGMGIASWLAQGYQNIDLDTRHRMAAISAEARKNYGGNYDPSLPQHSHDAGTKSPHTEQSPTGDAGGSI